MSRNWSADRYHLKGSVDATFDEMTRTNYHGQYRMERFIGYGELPNIMSNAAKEAGQMVLGKMLKEVSHYGNEPTIWLCRPRRDTRDRGLAEAEINFEIKAMAGWSWYSNTERHVNAFQTVFNHMKARVLNRYPEAECFMTHDYSGGYKFHVVVAPSIPYGMKEAA